MSAQDKTLEQYHQWMQFNAISHLIRSAREVGLFDALRDGQKTADALCASLSLSEGTAALLLDALLAVGVIEKYEEDYALSRASHLLCQYDEDLGDQTWQRLTGRLKGKGQPADLSTGDFFDHNAATQWIHTPAAMQAAEMLNIGGEDEIAGQAIVGAAIADLGCGSAVWSCAMAHRDKDATVTAVDHAAALAAANSTAASIELSDRFTPIEGDPLDVDLPADHFDIVLLAQRLSALADDQASQLIARAVRIAKPGGRVVVIDLFRSPQQPTASEAVQALILELETPSGHVRQLKDFQVALADAGLEQIQFSFLPASRSNLGLMVARKPQS